jgi:uncharacterized repeat protein (TIGR01451 family)
VCRFNSRLVALILAVGLIAGNGAGNAQQTDRPAPTAFKLIDAGSRPEPSPQVPVVIPPAARVEKVPRPAPKEEDSAPALMLRKIGPATLSVDQPFTYEIVVRNVGTAAAGLVIVEDVLPPEMALLEADPRPDIQGRHLGWGLGTLPAGAERHLKIEAKLAQGIKELPPAAASFATSCAMPQAPAAVEPAATVPARLLDLKISGPKTVAMGEHVVFQLEMTNHGASPLIGVVLRDILPPGLKHPQGSDIEADLAPLAPHETRKITLAAIAFQAGRQVNEAQITATQDLGKGIASMKVEGKASAVVEVIDTNGTVVQASGVQVPALTVNVRNKDTVAEVGATTTYEITVANQGGGAGTRVQVMVMLPEGMQPQLAQGPTSFHAAGRQIIFEPMARLDPGQQAQYRIQAKCQRPGDWRFKVQLAADQLRLPVCKEEIMRVYDDR